MYTESLAASVGLIFAMIAKLKSLNGHVSFEHVDSRLVSTEMLHRGILNLHK